MTRRFAFVAALFSLAVCLLAPVLYVAGRIAMDGYKTVFLIASIAWFVAATVYDVRRHRAGTPE